MNEEHLIEDLFGPEAYSSESIEKRHGPGIPLMRSQLDACLAVSELTKEYARRVSAILRTPSETHTAFFGLLYESYTMAVDHLLKEDR